MILIAVIALFSVAFMVLWFVWPEPDAEELPALGDSIDRAIALAAALPDDDDVFTTKRTVPSHIVDIWAGLAEVQWAPPRACANCDALFATDNDLDEICGNCVAVGHGQIRAGRFVPSEPCAHVGLEPPPSWVSWMTPCLKCGERFELTRNRV